MLAGETPGHAWLRHLPCPGDVDSCYIRTALRVRRHHAVLPGDTRCCRRARRSATGRSCRSTPC
eukprot:2895715-Prymnesium_polylepis.1